MLIAVHLCRATSDHHHGDEHAKMLKYGLPVRFPVPLIALVAVQDESHALWLRVALLDLGQMALLIFHP
jgi:hypothetical protein